MKKKFFSKFFISTQLCPKKELSRIKATKMKFLRGIVHEKRRDRKQNYKIRKTLNVEKLTTDIEKNRLKWFGHLKRIEKGRLPQRMLNLKVQGKQNEEDHGKDGLAK